MSKTFGKYIDEFEEVIFCEKHNKNDVYSGYNIKEKRPISLKVINKEQISDYNLFIKNLEKEVQMVKLCKSDYILDFYRYMETDKNIIKELSWYETNLYEYIKNNGPCSDDKNFFKSAAIQIAKAVKIIHDKKIMHRYIKTNNVFVKEEHNVLSLRLGEFSKAIFIKDNTYESVDKILYSAPEIINGEKYDERCDLWSFGLVLYELYFGELPYGYKPTKNKVIKAVNGEGIFNIKKSNIPSLDYILEGLLKFNKEERMNFDQLFKYIFSDKFMEKNEDMKIKRKESLIDIIKDEKSLSLSSSFKSDSFISTKSDIKDNDDDDDDTNKNKYNFNNQIQEKYNNIIYYDENDEHIKSVYKDSNLFEKETNGAFILCRNKDCFNIIKEEILIEYKKDSKIAFNIITTGSAFEKLIQYLLQDKQFTKCFKNICIYCINVKKYEHFKKKYKNKVHDNIYDRSDDVIKFIEESSSEKIRPYKIFKLITQNYFMEKYQNRYNKLLYFYGNFEEGNYKKYIKEITNLINEMDKKNNLTNKKNNLIEGFKKLDIHNNSHKIIINEFLNTIYDDLNNFLKNSDLNSEDCLMYFTSVINFSFINYANEKWAFYEPRKNEIYMDANLPLSELLQYKRAKGKITFPYFTKFYEKKNILNQHLAKNMFSAIFILNIRERNISAIDLNNLISNKEKVILIFPFTFLKFNDIKLDLKKYQAEIYLETL